MTANIMLKNVDNAVLNAIKSVIKLNPQVKFKINKSKESDDELLEAIAELQEMKKKPHLYKGYANAKDMIEACLDE